MQEKVNVQILQILRKASEILNQQGGDWAICGGVAAAIYRDTPRFTADVDIALLNSSQKSALERAQLVATELGYNPIAGWITDQHGNLITSQALVVGREPESSKYLGIDFILPVLPWVEEAVQRAQLNIVDYGFKGLPTIIVEDLCIAKLFALRGTPSRLNDLDDMLSIARASKKFDRALFQSCLDKFSLVPPEEFMQLIDAI